MLARECHRTTRSRMLQAQYVEVGSDAWGANSGYHAERRRPRRHEMLDADFADPTTLGVPEAIPIPPQTGPQSTATQLTFDLMTLFGKIAQRVVVSGRRRRGIYAMTLRSGPPSVDSQSMDSGAIRCPRAGRCRSLPLATCISARLQPAPEGATRRLSGP